MDASLLATSALMVCLPTIAVALRFIARHHTRSTFHVDDFLVVFALLLTIAQCGSTVGAVAYGLGKYRATIPLEELRSLIKIRYAHSIIYGITTTVIRVAILVFYWRIFVLRTYQTILLGAIAIVVCSGLVTTLMVVLQCLPARMLWTNFIDGYCMDLTTLQWNVVAHGIVGDFVVLLLPLPVIWKLIIPTGKKIALLGIFMLGGSACVISIARAPSTLAIAFDFQFTLTGVLIAKLALLECGIGIICACLPTIAPLVRRRPSRKNSNALPCTAGESQSIEHSHRGSVSSGLKRLFIKSKEIAAQDSYEASPISRPPTSHVGSV